MTLIRLATMLALATPSLAHADPADIVSAEARDGKHGWTIAVTLAHGDTGWDDYADGWRVIGPDGTVLGTRILAHPHVNEQPFTRNQSGIKIPKGVTEVEIESSTNVTGWSGPRFTLALPGS